MPIDAAETHWRKSTFSGQGGMDCGEVADPSYLIIASDTDSAH